jgi:predicted  nucleic acid-binding Zn-ribbon protein
MGYGKTESVVDPIRAEIEKFEAAVKALDEKLTKLEKDSETQTKAAEELVNKIADLGNVYKTVRDKIDEHVLVPDAHHCALVARKRSK